MLIVTHKYIDASCNHQQHATVVGCYDPTAIDSMILVHLPGINSSTDAELEGYNIFEKNWPSIPGHVYHVHTDCTKLMKLNDLDGRREDILFVKEIGHGKQGVVNVDFKKIDKATRRAVRRIVKNPDTPIDEIISCVIDHFVGRH